MPDLDLDRERRRVVLDRRSVLVEERWEERRRRLESLGVGEVVEGRVSVLVGFGAFVDLEGIDGLVHVSELPRDALDPRTTPSGRLARRSGSWSWRLISNEKR